VSLRIAAPTRTAKWTFVYAPGAAGSLAEQFGQDLARILPDRGVAVVRFQFPYTEAGRRAPDRPPVLEATWRAAIALARETGGRLCVGGRSMGGRIASQVVAGGEHVDALALLAYPLHAPGKPEQLRDGHLPAIRVPTLFVSGTNDAFGSPAELRSAARKVKGARLHLLDGADHGFSVKKSSGRTRQDVHAEAIETLAAWLESRA